MPPHIVVNYIIKAKQTVATVATIIDNLNSTSTEDGLSANMGRILDTKVSISETPPETSNVAKLWVDTSPILTGGNPDLLYNNSSSGGWQSLLSSVFAYNNPNLKMSKSNVIYFTPQVGESWSDWGGCFYYKRGTTVTVHIAVKLGTSNRVRVFNLPVGYRPSATVVAWGGGADGEVPDSSFCETYDSGDVMVKSNSQYALILYSFDVFA